MWVPTCNGKDHYFNHIFDGKLWNRKCDCGKKKLTKKKYQKFLKSLENKVE